MRGRRLTQLTVLGDPTPKISIDRESSRERGAKEEGGEGRPNLKSQRNDRSGKYKMEKPCG